MSLSKAKIQERQFLGTWYPADIEESPMVPSKELAGIDLLSCDLEAEGYWDLADLMEGFTKVVGPVSEKTMGIFVKRARWLASPFPPLLW